MKNNKAIDDPTFLGHHCEAGHPAARLSTRVLTSHPRQGHSLQRPWTGQGQARSNGERALQALYRTTMTSLWPSPNFPVVYCWVLGTGMGTGNWNWDVKFRRSNRKGGFQSGCVMNEGRGVNSSCLISNRLGGRFQFHWWHTARFCMAAGVAF